MKTPLVSVIVPTYNRATYIRRAIQSVQYQSFSDFELLVVDDHSRDETAEIVAPLSMADPRIHWILHPVNKGSQAARNTGIRAARGAWIAFLDSDDEWLPSSLEVRLNEAEKQRVKIVYSDCLMEEAGNQKRTLFGIKPLYGMAYKELLADPGPMFQSLLIQSDALEKIDYLDESIVSFQEWDTSIRLAKRYKFGFVQEPTFIYHRIKDETISANPLRSARGYEQVMNKHVVDIRKMLGRKGLARHELKLAVYYTRARHYRSSLKYFVRALRELVVGVWQ